MARALVIDDEQKTLHALSTLVEDEGFDVVTARDLKNARFEIKRQKPDVILSDLILPDGQGTELLQELQEDNTVEIILVTGHATIDSAVEALRLGAYDYLTKPIDVPRLQALLAGVNRTRELKRQVSSLRSELRKLGRFGSMVGTSPPMQRVYDLVERVAPTDASVFLIGESGTGKELASQTLHQLSKRSKEAFLPVNCGAISPNLIESELFGHERGSFTGANRQHQGYFEQANRGSILLDEITEMPIELQVKLLRVLETQAIMRVGSTKPIPVDVRIIAATNRDPEKAVEDGKLREDLLYRLKVFPIYLPPLRERQGDIEILANHMLERLNKQHGEKKRFANESLERLGAHSWPGNVRELKNVVERAFILADEEITPDSLPPEVGGTPLPTGPYLQLKVGISLADAEKRLILATLDQEDGNKKEAANILGVSLKTLYNRLNQYKEEDGESAEADEEEEEETAAAS